MFLFLNGSQGQIFYYNFMLLAMRFFLYDCFPNFVYLIYIWLTRCRLQPLAKPFIMFGMSMERSWPQDEHLICTFCLPTSGGSWELVLWKGNIWTPMVQITYLRSIVYYTNENKGFMIMFKKIKFRIFGGKIWNFSWKYFSFPIPLNSDWFWIIQVGAHLLY